MPFDSRERVRNAQQQLARALTDRAGVPPRFATDRISLAASRLLLKRRRAVARSSPVLCRALGNDFADAFERYAKAHPVQDGDASRDAERFARFLKREGRVQRPARAREWITSLISRVAEEARRRSRV